MKVLIEEEDYKLVIFYDDPNHPKVITDLLSKGENIEVISPQSLVDTMRTHAQNMAKRYKCWKK